jgi:hypothetical protein
MVKPVGMIIANLIAFRALFQFVDAVFEWIFSNLGLKNFGLVVRRNINVFNSYFIVPVNIYLLESSTISILHSCFYYGR